MTTTERDITKDMTAVEAANLLARLEQGHRAAWLSTREAPWHSAEYQARFQNAVEVDGVFRDVMRETVKNGMRRPGEPVEEFAERAGSEAWLAGVRTAGLEPHADPAIRQLGAGMPPEHGGDSQYEVTTRRLDDTRRVAELHRERHERGQLHRSAACRLADRRHVAASRL